MTPANERKAAERQRRKDAGLVRCEVWVQPEIKRLVQKTVAQMVAAQSDLRKLGAVPLTDSAD